MTERTIRTLAKELAGQFYEAKRSDRFRSKNSMTRSKTLKQLPDGSVIEVPVIVPFFVAYPNSKAFAAGHWPLFVDAARRCLVTMLALPDSRIDPEMKKSIYKAIIEDRENQRRRPGSQTLIQRSLEFD